MKIKYVAGAVAMLGALLSPAAAGASSAPIHQGSCSGTATNVITATHRNVLTQSNDVDCRRVGVGWDFVIALEDNSYTYSVKLTRYTGPFVNPSFHRVCNAVACADWTLAW